MSLKHAILGFLNYMPFSGYDLKKVFDTSVQHFWPADQSQIYRTLSRLSEAGLVEVQVVEQEDRPDRKVYSITDEGRQELRGWLAKPLPLEKARHATLIQVFFAGQLDDQAILSMLEREANATRELIARYSEVPEASAPYVDMVGSAREAFFWLLTLDFGVHITQAKLAWLESVIQRIKNQEHPSK